MLLEYKARQLASQGESVLFLVVAEKHPCQPTLLTRRLKSELADQIEVKQVAPGKVSSLVSTARQEGRYLATLLYYVHTSLDYVLSDTSLLMR